MRRQVDQTKLYPANEAIKLLLDLVQSKFDQTVAIHLNTRQDKITGEVKLPHGTGKKQKIVVFSEAVLKQLEQNKIEFDILVAKPTDMPKLAKYAKILGPKGLFPNPKNGTVSTDPTKTVTELSAGKTHYKTEAKAPLIHFVLGKISFGEKKLLENLEALLKSIGPRQIKKAVLSATHTPSIKIKVE